MEIAPIPPEQFSQYRYEAIFRAYKWDPQVEDRNTVSRHALLLRRETAQLLAQATEALAAETVAVETALLRDRKLAAALGLPAAIRRALERMPPPEAERHVRLMRFDFHPTATGWAVSEVNSDVPGGFAEASVLPALAARYFPRHAPGENTAARLLEAFQRRVTPGAPIAFVHATSYADDRQVMQYLSDVFRAGGLETLLAAPDHIRFRDRQALSIALGGEGPLGGIVRFYPLEWLPNLPRAARWQGYFDCETPACNHPIAMFAQSKRLPLVWDTLGVPLPAWKHYLPETLSPRAAPLGDAAWICKPALGRVGEGITIPEAVSEKEKARILRSARRHPRDWVAQRRFESRPLPAPTGERYHICIGAFSIDGKAAGLYGRMSPYPRIDARAEDIPVLIERE